MGLLEFVSDVYLAKQGKIPSKYRKEVDAERNRKQVTHDMKLSKFEAEVNNQARDEYTQAQKSRLDLEKQLKMDVANAGDDPEAIDALQNDYNKQIKTMNYNMRVRKTNLTGQLLSTGRYDFKPSELDSYQSYADAAQADGKKPVDESTWIFKKSIGNAAKVLEGMDYFNEASITSTNPNGTGNKYSIEKGSYKNGSQNRDDFQINENEDIVAIGTEGVSFQRYGAGKESRIKAKSNIVMAKTLAKEAGLDDKQTAALMRQTTGLNTDTKASLQDSIDEFSTALDKLSITGAQKKEMMNSFIAKKAGFSTGTSEFERLDSQVAELEALNSSGKLNEFQKKSLVRKKKRLTKMMETDLTSMRINHQFVQEMGGNVRQSMFENPKSKFHNHTSIDFGMIDMRNVSSEERADLQTYADYKLQAQKTSAAGKIITNALETTSSFTQLDEAMKTTISHLQSGQNVNLIDSKYREYIGKYFGYTDDQISRVVREKNTAGAFNILRRALFGATQSSGEMASFEQQVAKIPNTNTDLVLGMRSMLTMMNSKLVAQRDALGTEVFNIKFGAQASNIRDGIKAIDKAMGIGKGNEKTNKVVYSNPAWDKAKAEKKQSTEKKKSWKDYDKRTDYVTQ